MVDTQATSGLDQSNDRFIIDKTGMMTPVVGAIAAVARYKGLTISWADLNGPLNPSAQYKRMFCSGFWPIIRFLDRARPHPQVHPIDPDDQIMHDSQVELALVDSRCLDAFWARYADPGTETQYLGLQGRAPDLLDFTVGAYADSVLVHEHPWLRELADELEACYADCAGRD